MKILETSDIKVKRKATSSGVEKKPILKDLIKYQILSVSFHMFFLEFKALRSVKWENNFFRKYDF